MSADAEARISHLHSIEPELVNALCDRALALDDSRHVLLEVRGFRESRTPWDCRRLAKALAIEHDDEPLTLELFNLALPASSRTRH